MNTKKPFFKCHNYILNRLAFIDSKIMQISRLIFMKMYESVMNKNHLKSNHSPYKKAYFRFWQTLGSNVMYAK